MRLVCLSTRIVRVQNARSLVQHNAAPPRFSLPCMHCYYLQPLQFFLLLILICRSYFTKAFRSLSPFFTNRGIRTVSYYSLVHSGHRCSVWHTSLSLITA